MCSTSARRSILCIMPPHILREIAQRGSSAQRAAATNTLALDSTFRALRAAPHTLATGLSVGPGSALPGKRRIIYTARHQQQLPGDVVATEERPATRASDVAVYEAFQGLARRGTSTPMSTGVSR